IFSIVRIYALLVLLVFFFQDKLIFFPKDHAFADCQAAVTERFTIVDKTVGDAHVRLLREKSTSAKAWLLLFHGNGGTACGSVLLAERMMDLPVAFALVEYPGYEGDGEKP